MRGSSQQQIDFAYLLDMHAQWTQDMSYKFDLLPVLPSFPWVTPHRCHNTTTSKIQTAFQITILQTSVWSAAQTSTNSFCLPRGMPEIRNCCRTFGLSACCYISPDELTWWDHNNQCKAHSGAAAPEIAKLSLSNPARVLSRPNQDAWQEAAMYVYIYRSTQTATALQPEL